MNRTRWHPLLIIAALALCAAVASATYVLLSRLSDEVLAVLATVGCAAGVSFPSLGIALAILMRRQGAGHRDDHRGQAGTPMMLVVPPVQTLQQQPTMQVPTTVTHEPSARRFTIVGEE